MSAVTLIFPHQLFEEHPALSKKRKVILVEEYLFFRQFNFHKKKLVFHRASMKFYQDYLLKKGYKVTYIDTVNELSDVRKLLHQIGNQGTDEIHYSEVTDNWLEERLKKAAEISEIELVEYFSPMFINSVKDINEYFSGRKKYFQTDFYKHERKRLGILVEDDYRPSGGKWSFDAQNRNRYPKNKRPPKIRFPEVNDHLQEARHYVSEAFPNNYGELDDEVQYPVTFQQAHEWLEQFIKERFRDFGPYEDAIVAKESFLNHGVLSPLLNAGLLRPDHVVDEVLQFVEKERDFPLNSLEGFIRQVIGWREFIRAVYIREGSRERTNNFWGFKRKIPESFWKGTTGIVPVDTVIEKVLNTGYCHHIERLMVLGNFMLLCEFDPDEVYRWFMEMFIDAYDWVMVPNVYGMSQFADGGLMSTKPYISSSNYLMKMGDFPKGDWQQTWDALFWRFMHVHRDYFLQNPRSGMLIRTFDRMEQGRREALLVRAEDYLCALDIH
jgi:deoxyribodipyrimidine photolyase-related protein